MRRWLGALALASLFVFLTSSAAVAAPEDELQEGEGFDIATFFDLSGDGVADADNPALRNTPWVQVDSEDGFNCTKTGAQSNCQMDVLGGRQFFSIKPDRSGGIGDVGIRREFFADPDHFYAAAATIEYVNANLTNGSNLWARLTVVGTSLDSTFQANPECNTEVKLSKDGITNSSNPDPIVETLVIPPLPTQPRHTEGARKGPLALEFPQFGRNDLRQ